MPGCKRILLSDDYYPALQRPNVQVITDGIDHIDRDGIHTTDGIARPVDAIVLATGFRVTDCLGRLDIIAPDGRALGDVWRQGMQAFKGTFIAGFPNLAVLTGPNTGLGHNSMIFMIEA
ncbi:MAG: 4-hydroxyacetophenone monooxygenase, partial [Myxococcales bacterium]|nr:4-hydroxyacetophenone monooxygenase [Myxococcales bacterium]